MHLITCKKVYTQINSQPEMESLTWYKEMTGTEMSHFYFILRKVMKKKFYENIKERYL